MPKNCEPQVLGLFTTLQAPVLRESESGGQNPSLIFHGTPAPQDSWPQRFSVVRHIFREDAYFVPLLAVRSAHSYCGK